MTIRQTFWVALGPASSVCKYYGACQRGSVGHTVWFRVEMECDDKQTEDD